MSPLTRWRNRPMSPRRARAVYEAARWQRLRDELRAENERRKQERNRPCQFCADLEEARR